MHAPCETVLLGQSQFCTVSHCADCKAYHLHIGPMTMHLKEKVFESVCEVLIDVYMRKNKHTHYIDQSIHQH